ASLLRDRDSFKPPVPVAPPPRRLSVRNPLRSLRPPASKSRTRRATPVLSLHRNRPSSSRPRLS
ncbi:hypothetical protein S83_036388, partial [Arachis hypogaea]